MWGLGFRVWGLGFRVFSLGFTSPQNDHEIPYGLIKDTSLCRILFGVP